jgi:hypothetical protein
VAGSWENAREKRRGEAATGWREIESEGTKGLEWKHLYEIYGPLTGQIVPARARAGTVSWGFGSRTTLRTCRAGNGTISTVSDRVRVIFFSVVSRAVYQVRSV